MTIRLLKEAVRAEALARRASIGPAMRERIATSLARTGLLALRHLGPRPSSAPAILASAFLPIRGEPDTLRLIAALAEAGVGTALPATPPRGEPLRFRLWRPGEPLAAGRFGTREPAGGAALAEPDVLFVPLAAFDARGFRLGYGAGYYDGALRRLRAAKPVLAVGVAFAAQEVERVPTEAHDQPLDALVTELGLTTFGPA